MGVVDLAVHLLNFAAPALFTALLLLAAVRLIWRKKAFAHVWYVEFAITFGFCLFFLLAGLWFFGHDGTLASYAAMVLGCATCQWWMLRKI